GGLERALGLESWDGVAGVRHAGAGARSLDPLREPLAALAPGEEDACGLVRAGRDEVCSVLGDARAVVHQHEVDRLDLELGALLGEGLAGGLGHGVAVPAAVAGPRLLESAVHGADPVVDPGPRGLATRGEEAARDQ